MRWQEVSVWSDVREYRTADFRNPNHRTRPLTPGEWVKAAAYGAVIAGSCYGLLVGLIFLLSFA